MARPKLAWCVSKSATALWPLLPPHKGFALRDASGKTSAAGPTPGTDLLSSVMPKVCLLQSDACRAAPEANIRTNWRALFEQRELARFPFTLCSPHGMWLNGASMVLATFAETKVARRTGAKPRH